MPTRNVVLTDSQTHLIDRLIADGRYQNASEALRAGLRLLEREEAEMEALRTRIAESLSEARSGALADGTGEEAIRRAFAAARSPS
ncbi:MAG: type II toxin-antitoxin system ParD family antitoxin [Paracoccaceae bacterium]|nr:type II toxin-antitoxin system ParD family antitoxin [Paracoccaceae bacterium]